MYVVREARGRAVARLDLGRSCVAYHNKEMKAICFETRELTAAELDRVHAGFARTAAEYGNPSEPSVRVTCVAQTAGAFVGCASGLRHNRDNWFFVTDLFVERGHRREGIGAALLHQLEHQATALGVRWVWTWTAAFEAPEFYRRLGYEVFCEQREYYPSGHSRWGLRKQVTPREPLQ